MKFLNKFYLGNLNNSTLHTLDIDNLELRDQGEVLCSIAQHPTVSTTCQLLVEDAQDQCKKSFLKEINSFNIYIYFSGIFCSIKTIYRSCSWSGCNT